VLGKPFLGAELVVREDLNTEETKMAKATATDRGGLFSILVETLKMLVKEVEEDAAIAAAQDQAAGSPPRPPDSGSSPVATDSVSGSGTADPASSTLSDVASMFDQMEGSLLQEFEKLVREEKLARTCRAIAGVAQVLEQTVRATQGPIGGTAPGSVMPPTSTVDPEFCKKVAECFRQMTRAQQMRKAATSRPRGR